MREGIHPKYEETTITCACGNVIHTRSTQADVLTDSRRDLILTNFQKERIIPFLFSFI